MPKINKDFSDALGFRLLSNYQSFAIEYPVEGAKIQKLYDDGFKETCFKCYPIIAEAGVDPSIYESKSQPAGGIKTELRKMFPIKKVEPKQTFAPPPSPVQPIDLTDDEEELTLSNLTQTPALPRPSPLKPPSPKQCLNCAKLQAQITDLENVKTALIRENNRLIKENKELAEKNTSLERQTKNLSSTVSQKIVSYNKLEQLFNELKAKKSKQDQELWRVENENKGLIVVLKQYHSTVRDLDAQIDREVKKRKQ